MKTLSLALVAALAASAMALPSAAQARPRHGHHWQRHRVCRMVWRHHHRVRVCHWR